MGAQCTLPPGMGWDGMGWGARAPFPLGWDGMRAPCALPPGMGWDGGPVHPSPWDGMGWDGMGGPCTLPPGMGWDGMGGPVYTSPGPPLLPYPQPLSSCSPGNRTPSHSFRDHVHVADSLLFCILSSDSLLISHRMHPQSIST